MLFVEILRGLDFLRTMIYTSDERHMQFYRLLKDEFLRLLNEGFLISTPGTINYEDFNLDTYEETMQAIKEIINQPTIEFTEKEIYWDRIYIIIEPKNSVFCQLLKQYITEALSKYFSYCLFTIDYLPVFVNNTNVIWNLDNETIIMKFETLYEIYRRLKESGLINQFIEDYGMNRIVKENVAASTKQEIYTLLTKKISPYQVTYLSNLLSNNDKLNTNQTKKFGLVEMNELTTKLDSYQYYIMDTFYNSVSLEMYLRTKYGISFYRFNGRDRLLEIINQLNKQLDTIENDNRFIVNTTILFEKSDDTKLYFIPQSYYFGNIRTDTGLYLVTSNSSGKCVTHGHISVAPVFKIPVNMF